MSDLCIRGPEMAFEERRAAGPRFPLTGLRGGFVSFVVRSYTSSGFLPHGRVHAGTDRCRSHAPLPRHADCGSTKVAYRISRGRWAAFVVAEFNRICLIGSTNTASS